MKVEVVFFENKIKKSMQVTAPITFQFRSFNDPCKSVFGHDYGLICPADQLVSVEVVSEKPIRDLSIGECSQIGMTLGEILSELKKCGYHAEIPLVGLTVTTDANENDIKNLFNI